MANKHIRLERNPRRFLLSRADVDIREGILAHDCVKAALGIENWHRVS
jgi:hypothetical protein